MKIANLCSLLLKDESVRIGSIEDDSIILADACDVKEQLMVPVEQENCALFFTAILQLLKRHDVHIMNNVYVKEAYNLFAVYAAPFRVLDKQSNSAKTSTYAIANGQAFINFLLHSQRILFERGHRTPATDIMTAYKHEIGDSHLIAEDDTLFTLANPAWVVGAPQPSAKW